MSTNVTIPLNANNTIDLSLWGSGQKSSASNTKVLGPGPGAYDFKPAFPDGPKYVI